MTSRFIVLRNAGAILALALLSSPVSQAAPPRPTPRTCSAPAEFLKIPLGLRRTSARVILREPLRIVAIGSSSTYGAGASSPAHSYPSTLEAELRLRLPGQAIDVINKGVGGETDAEMIARFDRDVFALHPDLVIWQVGTNAVLRDENPQRDLRLISDGIQKLRGAGLDVLIMDMQYAPRVLARPGYQLMERGIALAAKEHGVPVFHRFDLMQDWVESKELDFKTMLAPDRLHLNDLSYGCIGRALADAIVLRAQKPVLTSHR